MNTCIGAPPPHLDCPHGSACDWPGAPPRLQTFAAKNEKYGVVRDPDGTNLRPIVLRSYKDKRAAKNRVARKQRKTNRK